MGKMTCPFAFVCIYFAFSFFFLLLFCIFFAFPFWLLFPLFFSFILLLCFWILLIFFGICLVFFSSLLILRISYGLVNNIYIYIYIFIFTYINWISCEPPSRFWSPNRVRTTSAVFSWTWPPTWISSWRQSRCRRRGWSARASTPRRPPRSSSGMRRATVAVGQW